MRSKTFVIMLLLKSQQALCLNTICTAKQFYIV